MSTITLRAATSKVLHNVVERAVVANIGNPDFRKYLEATTDAESVTGRRKYDRILAAHYLMNSASHRAVLAHETVQTISRSITVALRRYGLAPSQRTAKAA